MFKLFRVCSNCGKMYEQNLDNYMGYNVHGATLLIGSNVLKMDWDCSDCVLAKSECPECGKKLSLCPHGYSKYVEMKTAGLID